MDEQQRQEQEQEQRQALEQKARGAVFCALKAVEGLSPDIVTHLTFCTHDPDDLRVYLAYQDRATRMEAATSGHQDRVRREVVAALNEEGYPAGNWLVEFVSVQEVDAAGGPWKYFR